VHCRRCLAPCEPRRSPHLQLASQSTIKSLQHEVARLQRAARTAQVQDLYFKVEVAFFAFFLFNRCCSSLSAFCRRTRPAGRGPRPSAQRRHECIELRAVPQEALTRPPWTISAGCARCVCTFDDEGSISHMTRALDRADCVPYIHSSIMRTVRKRNHRARAMWAVANHSGLSRPQWSVILMGRRAGNAGCQTAYSNFIFVPRAERGAAAPVRDGHPQRRKRWAVEQMPRPGAPRYGSGRSALAAVGTAQTATKSHKIPHIVPLLDLQENAGCKADLEAASRLVEKAQQAAQRW
jgi:hypothetical protein